MKSIYDVEVENKKVLVRCDFNVSVDDKGNIQSDFKIIKSLPTILYLVSKKAKVIIMTHFDPEETGFVAPEFTLEKIGTRLSELLKMPVLQTSDCIGKEVQEKVEALESGQILLLENLRFHKEETDLPAQAGNSKEFAQKLAALADIYVNDAFAVCHRAHASVVGVAEYIPSYMGLLLAKEVESLDTIIRNPQHPLVAVIGGNKVSTKTAFINNISKVADAVLISGLMKKEAEEKNIVFLYPEKIVGPEDDLIAKDISENAITLFTEQIMAAKTVIWNGPFGMIEDEAYIQGTLEIAKAIIASKSYSVVGGGQTIEFLEKQGMLDEFSHVSTGGGAMLDYLSGEELPGLKALTQYDAKN